MFFKLFTDTAEKFKFINETLFTKIKKVVLICDWLAVSAISNEFLSNTFLKITLECPIKHTKQQLGPFLLCWFLILATSIYFICIRMVFGPPLRFLYGGDYFLFGTSKNFSVCTCLFFK